MPTWRSPMSSNFSPTGMSQGVRSVHQISLAVPQPPVVMPDDVVLDDIELEIADVALEINEVGSDDEDVEGADAGNAAPARADRSPSPVRIATPEYPREADRRNIRAEVIVEVLPKRARTRALI